MVPTIAEKRSQQIKASVKQRRVERLGAEMVAMDWNLRPRFADVDDFLTFAYDVGATSRPGVRIHRPAD